MEEKSFELFTEEDFRFHEEFIRCKSEEDFEKLEKKWNKLYESKENKEIPHYDMTAEEFLKKYGLVTHEEVWKDLIAKC